MIMNTKIGGKIEEKINASELRLRCEKALKYYICVLSGLHLN